MNHASPKRKRGNRLWRIPSWRVGLVNSWISRQSRAVQLIILRITEFCAPISRVFHACCVREEGRRLEQEKTEATEKAAIPTLLPLLPSVQNRSCEFGAHVGNQ